MSEEQAENIEEEEVPLKVQITNQPEIKEISTSEDTEDIYNYTPSDEEIKEMTDAQ